MLISTFVRRSAYFALVAGILFQPVPAAAQSGAAQSSTGVNQVGRTQTQDWVISNGKLRVRVRPDSLTVTVEDLAGGETWTSDPWENSAGRLHLRGKHGETTIVNLASAEQKRVETLPGDTYGVQMSLSRFRSRMGPVREDRDPDDVS